MYGMVNTHKVGKPVHEFTTGCNTAFENLSILVVENISFS